MTTFHVTDSEATIIRAALAGYAESIRQEARLHSGGYSPRGIELHVLRLNVEAVIEAVNRPPAPANDDRVIPIDSWREVETRAA
jgi:hypothetical protein